eukprot:scaffold7502_cov29-Phaeocystis_antarctica.AAC.2
MERLKEQKSLLLQVPSPTTAAAAASAVPRLPALHPCPPPLPVTPSRHRSTPPPLHTPRHP